MRASLLRSRVLLVTALMPLAAATLIARSSDGPAAAQPYVVFAYNDLGMHCMNDDFSEIVILPPYNNLRAQVLRRGTEPDIEVESGHTLTYRVPSNGESSSKTNFWTYAGAAFGVALPPDTGLTGNGLSGTMQPTPHDYYEATGIPITPITDTGLVDPYQLATVELSTADGDSASTVAVVPVSSEMSCNLCHGAPGISTATDILRKHDADHGTNLEASKPVLCAGCHADPALGTTGAPGVSSFSSAMHGFHAPHVSKTGLANECYACHPGVRTECQRDIHLAEGIQCTECHGSMSDVGNPARAPWVDEPRCGPCHSRPGFEFEQPGTLFKDSVGHGGVLCSSCHGSPHAITPAVTAVDNAQAMQKQGHTGVIDDCLVCHTQQPGESFFHRREN